MSKFEISDPFIAAEKFNNLSEIKTKLSKDLWRKFIEQNASYFTWSENTESGQLALKNISKLPDSLKEKRLRLLDRCDAYAEFDSQRGFYLVRYCFNDGYGTIGTTYQKKIQLEDLKLIVKMADYISGLAQTGSSTTIDQTFIDNYS
jgi:hypothetical protein